MVLICFLIAANVSQYAHYVFGTLDHNNTGLLSFEVSCYCMKGKNGIDRVGALEAGSNKGDGWDAEGTQFMMGKRRK